MTKWFSLFGKKCKGYEEQELETHYGHGAGRDTLALVKQTGMRVSRTGAGSGNNDETDFAQDWFIPFGSIRLQGVIGKGAMGQVLKATVDEVPVAAKRMPIMEGIMEDIKREAQVVANMHHPNILQFHGVSINKADHEIYLLVELMKCSLDQVLFSPEQKFKAVRQKLTGPIKQRVLLQIAYGLLYLHRRGNIHRDIKPANVLCADMGMKLVKVADFGTSTRLQKTTQMMVSNSRDSVGYLAQELTTNLGTPAYMAPELVSDSRRITVGTTAAQRDAADREEEDKKSGWRRSARTSTSSLTSEEAEEEKPRKSRNSRSSEESAASKLDTYSYGVLLYALTTGLKPYSDLETCNTFTMMNQIVGGLRPTLPVDYPVALRDLLARCWHADPGTRPSMSEITTLLREECIAEALEWTAAAFVPDRSLVAHLAGIAGQGPKLPSALKNELGKVFTSMGIGNRDSRSLSRDGSFTKRNSKHKHRRSQTEGGMMNVNFRDSLKGIDLIGKLVDDDDNEERRIAVRKQWKQEQKHRQRSLGLQRTDSMARQRTLSDTKESDASSSSVPAIVAERDSAQSSPPSVSTTKAKTTHSRERSLSAPDFANLGPSLALDDDDADDELQRKRSLSMPLRRSLSSSETVDSEDNMDDVNLSEVMRSSTGSVGSYICMDIHSSTNSVASTMSTASTAAVISDADAAGVKAALAAKEELSTEVPFSKHDFLDPTANHTAAGIWFDSTGDSTRSVLAFESAVQFHGRHDSTCDNTTGRATPHMNLAVALMRVARFSEAHSNLCEALRIEPENELARQNMAELVNLQRRMLALANQENGKQNTNGKGKAAKRGKRTNRSDRALIPMLAPIPEVEGKSGEKTGSRHLRASDTNRPVQKASSARLVGSSTNGTNAAAPKSRARSNTVTAATSSGSTPSAFTATKRRSSSSTTINKCDFNSSDRDSVDSGRRETRSSSSHSQFSIAHWIRLPNGGMMRVSQAHQQQAAIALQTAFRRMVEEEGTAHLRMKAAAWKVANKEWIKKNRQQRLKERQQRKKEIEQKKRLAAELVSGVGAVGTGVATRLTLPIITPTVASLSNVREQEVSSLDSEVEMDQAKAPKEVEKNQKREEGKERKEDRKKASPKEVANHAEPARIAKASPTRKAATAATVSSSSKTAKGKKPKKQAETTEDKKSNKAQMEKLAQKKKAASVKLKGAVRAVSVSAKPLDKKSLKKIAKHTKPVVKTPPSVKSPASSGSDVFSRLTNPKSYTGTQSYKESHKKQRKSTTHVPRRRTNGQIKECTSPATIDP